MGYKRQNPSPRARRVLRGFTKWRRQRQGRKAIPSELWREAAELAVAEGVCQTARLLRLDYKDLKSQMRGVGDSTLPKDVFMEYRLSGAGEGLSCRIVDRRLKMTPQSSKSASNIDHPNLLKNIVKYLQIKILIVK